MIVSLQGILVEATPLSAVLEVGGVGYEVHVPVSTAERLPKTGERTRLLTVAVYREDSQALYGFATAEERDFFRLLVDHVSGVGPKLAITILSRLSIPVLRAAIVDGDVGLLSKCHGIGRKTAERLVVELKDKLAAGPSPTASPGGAGTAAIVDARDLRLRDATLALTALGYKLPDAEKAVRQVAAALGPDTTTEQLVKRALSG